MQQLCACRGGCNVQMRFSVGLIHHQAHKHCGHAALSHAGSRALTHLDDLQPE